MPRRFAFALCLTLIPPAAGCARALREPPPLAELTGSSGTLSQGDAESMSDRARAAWERRGMASVSEAARLWLSAAADESVRVEALLGAARADAWLADHATEPDVRKRHAESAVAAAQWCGRADPDEVRCTYWLALALGVQARERRATALDALPRIVEMLEQVLAISPEMDQAGPHRALALVYLRAPGWPSGPGDPDLGLDQALRAAAIAPDYPPNQLVLGEALWAVDETDAARAAYRRARDLAEKRQASGEIDAIEWLDEAERAMSDE